MTDEAGEKGSGRWPVDRLKPVLEALIFASGDPLPVRRACELIEGSTPAEIKAALCELQRDCEQRGFRLLEVAGGWQFRTAPEHHAVVKRLFKERPQRLTRAALETLSVVAYRQPVTRAEIEKIRGVDTSAVLEGLVERRLIRVCGRRDVPGRPLVYATTGDFLEMFALKDLKALPTLAELGDELRGLAEQSGFDEEEEEREARVLPLEEEESSGDEDTAAETAGKEAGTEGQRRAETIDA